MRKRLKSANVISLPPRLPRNAGELERVIMLLGERKKTELNERARNDLLQLLGVYPTVKEAAFWKRVLRRACQGIDPQDDALGNEKESAK
jgi:hypothetical protein